MHRLLLQIRFAPQATPPEGTPPTFEVASGPGTITVLASDSADDAPTTASYATAVTETAPGTFDELGTYHLGGKVFQVSTIAGGAMEPIGVGSYQRGMVGWRITDESSGTSGFVTSNVEIDASTGAADDCQVVRLYLP